MSQTFGFSTTGEEAIAGHDLTGKRIVVTGASSGLGAETARLLALAGAEVILLLRNMDAGKQIAQNIGEATKKAPPRIEYLDLGSLASVRGCAARLGKTPIHILINNAGLMATPHGRTADGFETQIGTNHFGHFLLTHLLMPNLLAAAPARVIALTSSAHLWSDVVYEDLYFERRAYNPWIAYAQSKTANVLFAVDLTRRFAGQGITANAVMPGRIETGLGRYTKPEDYKTVPHTPPPAGGKNANTGPKTLAQGVATTIWAAVTPTLEAKGGLYLEDCGVARPWSLDNPTRGVKPYALDPDNAKKLWTVSERAVSIA